MVDSWKTMGTHDKRLGTQVYMNFLFYFDERIRPTPVKYDGFPAGHTV